MTDTQCGKKYNHARNERDLQIHGERITLRRPNLQDARQVFEWERDPSAVVKKAAREALTRIEAPPG